METAIYLKTSDNNKSNQNRLSLLVERVKSEGGEYKIFSETDDKNGNQPLKKILMSRVYNREFDAILVYRLNEWLDTPAKLSLELNELFVNGIRFISHYENFDSFSLTGKLYMQVLLTLNGSEQSLNSNIIENGKSSNNSIDQPVPGNQKIRRTHTGKSPSGLNNFQRQIKLADIDNSGKYSITGQTSRIENKSEVTDNFDLIGLVEACNITGYSRHTLYQLTSRKLIPHFKRPRGRRLFFSKRALEQWILTGEV